MKNSICRVVFTALCVVNWQLFAQEHGDRSELRVEQPTPSPNPESELASPSFGKRNDDQWKRMRSTPPDQDREFLMVNLMTFRAKARYADGRETDLTGEQANARYAPIKFIAQIGGRIEFIGRVNEQMGNSQPRWEQVGIVRYPSRAKFFEMVTDPDFQKKAIHKDAGLEVSQVLVTERVPWKLSNAKRVGDESDAFTLAQLFKYEDTAKYAKAGKQKETRTGKEAMDSFDAVTEDLLRKVGAKPLLKTTVEGTLIGDGRTWDEFRLLHFPSQAAYTNYTNAVEEMEEAIKHREAAIDDVYTMKVEAMSLAKRLALSLATSVMGRKEPQSPSETRDKRQERP